MSAGRRTGPAALQGLALLGILALAAYLRFERLATNPGWYSDEGTLADIARHLADGQLQYQALTGSILVVARFPAVPLLVAGLMGAGGDALQTLRAVSASLGVISTAALYLTTRLLLGGKGAGLGLLAAGLFAVYPPAVFYARIGFSYNLLTPLMLITAAGLWLYFDRNRRAGALVAGLAIGLGSLTDLMMISALVAAGLIVLVRNPRDLRWWLPLSLAPLVVYLVSIAARDPQLLADDLRFIAARLAVVPWWAQPSLVVLNLGTLMLTEVWWIPALIGLTVLRPRRLGVLLLLLLLVPLILLGRTTGLAGLRLYSISPLFPWVALGVASLLWQGVPRLLAVGRTVFENQLQRVPWFMRTDLGRWTATRLTALGSAAIVFLLVGSPLLVSTFQLFVQLRSGFDRGNAWAYVPVKPAREAIRRVNRLASPGELVLASPALAWALDAQAADFQQVLAYSGIPSIDYPADLPRDRFAYALGLDRAAYVVVDSIWRDWGAVHLVAVEQTLRQVESWPIVWQGGGIVVYENPARPPTP